MELLWELITAEPEANHHGQMKHNGHSAGRPFVRLPGASRCTVLRKDGHRCRGRAKPGTDYCIFHDPAITPEERRTRAVRAAQSRRRRLPKGYPRRLDSSQAVERALTRLYAEVRLGKVDREAGRELFNILCQLARLHGGADLPLVPAVSMANLEAQAANDATVTA